MHSRLYTRVLNQYPWMHNCTALNSIYNNTGLVRRGWPLMGFTELAGTPATCGACVRLWLCAPACHVCHALPHPPCPLALPSPAPQVGVFASAESSQAAEMVDVLCKEMEVRPGAAGQKQFTGEGSLACRCSHTGERASMAGC